ncbi:NACHT, LRR and PYD domains-containing protein 10 [Thomomys bottae]
MTLALAPNPKEALLLALSDLEKNDFKILKFHLRDMTMARGQPYLPWGELQGLSPVDLASRLTLMYGAHEAVRLVLTALKTMHLLELVDRLSHVCLNDYREIYREHVRCMEEKEAPGINGSCNQLLLVMASSSESSGSPPCPNLEQELGTVQVEVGTLFGPEEPCSSPSLVVLQGSAGTGKTTLVRKMMLDWAAGTLYPGRFDYVFYVSCREVVLLPTCDLNRLLFWCCGDNQVPIAEILKQPERLLFILDGFDEFQRPFEPHLQKWRLSPMEKMLRLLIQRKSLPTCSLLITTRPPALQSLEHLLDQQNHRCVHILGFSEEERKKYFGLFFTDEEQARDALDRVSSNTVLYKACQVPGICWIVCSWLKQQMERGQLVLETPSNSTDIFTAYVSTFLPTDDDPNCSELTRHRVLRNLCSLAAEGIQHQRFLFEEADLRRHHLDALSLTAFLNCNDYQEGLDMKKFYSFRHISFQEYFYAMSFLVKEDLSQLGKEAHREVERLLGAKDQEGNKKLTLSMQFLLDISKSESTGSLGFKFCFKVAPSVMEALRRYKEQIESIKHDRSWDLEFSLYDNKIKSLAKGIEMSDFVFTIEHSNEKKSNHEKGIYIRSNVSKRQREEQRCSHKNKGNGTSSQKETLNMKGTGSQELDQEVRSSTLAGREKRAVEKEGKKDSEMQRLGDEKGRTKNKRE